MIVTGVPTVARVRLKLVMIGGGGMTVNGTPLLVIPPTTTVKFPLVAPEGTTTVMLVGLQLDGPKEKPLKST